MKNRLQEFRWKNKMSREELASRAGVSINTIYRIEYNQTSYIRSDTLYKLSVALNIEPYELYTDLEQTKPCEDILEDCLLICEKLRRYKLLYCADNWATFVPQSKRRKIVFVNIKDIAMRILRQNSI